MREWRIRPLPAMLGYPVLGATAGCLIVFVMGGLIAYYAVAFYPTPFLAAALGLAAARDWSRRSRRAFLGGCLGLMASTGALIPFGTNPGLLLPLMGVGLAVGVWMGLGIRR